MARSTEESERYAESLAQERGSIFVPAFNDPEIIAGIALSCQNQSRPAWIIGVELSGAAALYMSLKAGHIVIDPTRKRGGLLKAQL